MNSFIAKQRNASSVAIGVLVLVVAIFAWMQWTSHTTKVAIRIVLKQNAAIPASIINNAGFSDKYWDHSDMIARIVARMDHIDLSNCPKDFQVAYKNYVAAWNILAMAQGKNGGWNGFIKFFFTGGLGIIPAMNELDDAHKKILSTWQQVQQTAIKHGVAP